MKTLALLLAVALALHPGQTIAPKAAAPLARVAVIGASMSAGFGIGPSLLGGAVTIADIAHASIVEDHAAPRNLSSPLMFLDPAGYMERTSATLAQDPPSAVIALDYLFWSVHGSMSDDQRRQQLESALGGLEKVSCPILVGDLPDVTIATTGPLAQLTPDMMPSPALRDAANLRIREWARTRRNVTIIPLAQLMKNLLDGNAMQIRGNTWKETEVRTLMQADHLHPTAEGLVVIWIVAVDEWLRHDQALPENSFNLNAKILSDAVSSKLSSPAK
jgi:hypothetical protein